MSFDIFYKLKKTSKKPKTSSQKSSVDEKLLHKMHNWYTKIITMSIFFILVSGYLKKKSFPINKKKLRYIKLEKNKTL
jgi:hypothetical protein